MSNQGNEVVVSVDPGYLQGMSRSERRAFVRGFAKAARKSFAGNVVTVDVGGVPVVDAEQKKTPARVSSTPGAMTNLDKDKNDGTYCRA